MSLAAAVDLPRATLAAPAMAAMPVKDVHVILSDGGSADAAIDLARRLGARVKALVVEEQAELTDYYDDARAAVRARVMAASDGFDRLAAKWNVPCSVVEVAIPVSRSYAAVAHFCESSGLVVVEQSAIAARDGSRLMRRLLAESGSPIMVVPGPEAASPSYDRVAIACDGEPATASAVLSALPILKLARFVTILGMRNSRPGSENLAERLRNGGLEVDVAELGDVGSALETLCNAPNDRIDWVTMNRRRSGGLRDFILGNPVRRMLARATRPLLLLP